MLNIGYTISKYTMEIDHKLSIIFTADDSMHILEYILTAPVAFVQEIFLKIILIVITFVTLHLIEK